MKKLLLCALMLGIGMVSFAQDATELSVEEQVVVAHNEFMGALKSKLVDNIKSKPDFGELSKNKKELGGQFLAESNSLTFFSNESSVVNLYNIYSYITKKSNNVNVSVLDSPLVQTSKETTKGVINKDGEIEDEDKFVNYSTKCEVNTVASKADTLSSNAKYSVTLNWQVTLETKESKKGKVKSIELVSVSTDEIPYLALEKQQMKTTAEKLIKEWYANVSADQLASEVEGYTIVNCASINDDKTVVNAPNNPVGIVVAGESEIKLDLNPDQFIEPYDRMLYTNPKAYYVLSPKFTIDINDDLKTGEIKSVSYSKKLYKPETDDAKKERWEKQKNAADKTANTFAEQLSNYASATSVPDRKAIRAELDELFVDANVIVEVSNLSKQGKEKIEERKVAQYLSRFRASKLNIDVNSANFTDETFAEISYPINQEYFSKTYNDFTVKSISVKYDEAKDTFLINHITVKPNSTELR